MLLPQSLIVIFFGVVALSIHNIADAGSIPAKSKNAIDFQLEVPPNPFDKYIRVSDIIYVYDRSQFVPYNGPALSPRNPDAEDGIVERRRLGTISVAAGVKLNIESVEKPMYDVYEFRDPSTGKLIHEFSYFATGVPPLLFNGQGVVYEYKIPFPLCSGHETNKYELTDGKFVAIRQPMHFVNVKTGILRDVKLFSLPDTASSQVALLQKDMTVTVLAYGDSPDYLLIKTPLGLTGWLINDRSNSSVSITECN